jgi:hypothetical protein
LSELGGEGTPGTGKATLALQFLLEGRRLCDRGMYVTLSETAGEPRASAASHGWSLDGLWSVELVSEVGIGSEQEQTLLHPAEFELGETTGRILEWVEQERLVLDSLSELRLLAQTPLRHRRPPAAPPHGSAENVRSAIAVQHGRRAGHSRRVEQPLWAERATVYAHTSRRCSEWMQSGRRRPLLGTAPDGNH